MSPTRLAMLLAALVVTTASAPDRAVGQSARSVTESAPQGIWYADGGRRVDVVRRGRAEAPKVAAAEGLARSWTAVDLSYPGHPVVPALIDETVIVTIDSESATPRDETRNALRDQGVELIKPLMPSAGLWLARDTTGGDGLDASIRLRDPEMKGKGLRAAMPNLYVRMHSTGDYTPNDPMLSGQWFFENLHMTEAWGLSRGDAGTTIVVIDTGCDLTHEDLVDKMDQGRDVIDEDDDPSPDLTEKGSAHGTSCAGLVAASTDNGIGVAGACPECRLRCVRMVNNAALPISKNIEAFQFAIDVNAAVVSNSWGFTDALAIPEPLADAINQVFDHGRGGLGAPVVFAMGNDGRVVGTDELQGVRGVLGVGAINNTNQSTPFTNTGPTVDIVAPTGTLTTDITGAAGEDPTNYTNLFGGTSSACPVAAGIMGILIAADPQKTSQELYDIVTKTARKAPFAQPDSTGHDATYGYGIIDPVAALDDAMGISTGAGGAGGAGGAASKTNPSKDTSGCSCNVATTDSESASIWGACALALTAFARRRTYDRVRRRP